jgi:hypothetical protein
MAYGYYRAHLPPSVLRSNGTFMQINARRMSVPWIDLAGAIQLGQGARRKKHRAFNGTQATEQSSTIF